MKYLSYYLFLFFSLSSFSQVGIGNLVPNSSSILDISSTSKGFLLSRMTLNQRNEIISPTCGLQIYCLDCSSNGKLQIFNGTSWINCIGDLSNVSVPSQPLNPLATILNYSQVSFSFSPPISSGGSSISSYTVFGSPGNIAVTYMSSPTVLSGLTDGLTYSFYVVANNLLGNSSASTISSITMPSINGNAVCDGNGYIDVIELTSSTGKVWMDRNLGASRVALSSTDYYAYGCLYQWGRSNDGHASINWSSSTSGTPANGTTSSLSSTISPSNASFVTNLSTPNDWLSSQNNSLWQYSTDTNNPCPSGFRLPTAAEYATEFSVYDITNATTAFSNGPGNGFKFVMPGMRYGSDGSLSNSGSIGNYWTQSVNSTNATGNTIASTVSSASNSRANGLSVRCIKGNINSESITLLTYPQDSKVLLQYNSITNATDYVIHYKLNSVTTWSIYNDGVNTNLGVTVDGLTNGILYDFMVKAIVSNNTNVYSSLLSKSPSAIIDNNVYHQILATGQSLVFGYGPSLTNTQVYNNKMINLSKTELIPLREPFPANTWNQESSASALGNFISSASINSNGFDYKSIVTLSGWSGTGYSGLKKGTVNYSNGLLSLVAAKKLANLEGIPYVLGAFYVIHGESDYQSPAATYKSYLEEWQNDLQNDSKSITGQTGIIPMFLCQLSSSGSTYNNPTVPIGQLAAAEANPTKIYLVTPKYMLDYADAVHIPNYSQRRLGEYYGKVMKKVLVDGIAWKPLSPSTVSIAANVITVNFNVPVAPLQFDTTKVMSAANYGFEYFDSTNSASITNVALGSDLTSVVITLNTVPTGSNKKIAYAYSSDRLGGRYVVGSPKGNLRDSDTTPALYTTNLPANYGTELNNWCVHFIKDIP